jgi:hypothetical protein
VSTDGSKVPAWLPSALPAMLALVGVIAGSGLTTFAELRKEADEQRTKFRSEQLARAADIAHDLRAALETASKIQGAVLYEQLAACRHYVDAAPPPNQQDLDDYGKQIAMLRGPATDIVAIYFDERSAIFSSTIEQLNADVGVMLRSHAKMMGAAALHINSCRAPNSRDLGEASKDLLGFGSRITELVRGLVKDYRLS